MKLIRVFSKGVEKTDFPGPEHDDCVFPKRAVSAQCEEKHKKYSLHYIIRNENRDISEEEERFRELHCDDRIPSFDEIHEYRKMISSAEERVLRSGVNIILCTCNEAASHRLKTLKPKYCIIDECAMATEPECTVPIRRAEHVVLIGDHQQLQPVIHSKQAKQFGLGKSLLE